MMDAVSSRVLVLDSGESPSVKRTCPALIMADVWPRTRLVTASHTFTLFRYPSVITLRRRPGVSCRPSRRFQKESQYIGVWERTVRWLPSVHVVSAASNRRASVSAHRRLESPWWALCCDQVHPKSCWVIPHPRHGTCVPVRQRQASLCPANSAADPRVPVVDSPRIDRSTGQRVGDCRASRTRNCAREVKHVCVATVCFGRMTV